MKNLGKILILLTLFINTIFASVVASVDSNSIVRGEMVTLSLKLNGKDIQTPNIQSICSEDVISTSSQTSIEMINGNFSKSYVMSYKFLPQKSCEIEPIEVDIGGKKEYTKRIKIEVEAQRVTQDSPFILTLEASKNDVFVGETFDVTLHFKQRLDANAVDSEFVPPKLNGFWIKKESKPVRYKDDKHTTIKMIYTMAAQRDGLLKISPAQMKIATRKNTRDPWGSWMPQIKWKTFFSNELEINVKKLPNGVKLVGDFKITSSVDKTSINQNEAVNLTIKVEGDGNLEDIKTLKPMIDGVSIFDEKVDVKDKNLTQKIAFVSDRDFIIPPISLRYFNPITKEIKTIQTKEKHIDVKGSNIQVDKPLNIKRQENIENKDVTSTSNSLNTSYSIVIFIFGVLIGVLIMFIKPKISFAKKDTLDVKDEKKLLIKLLPHESDKDVKGIMDILEGNIYSDKKEKVDKKILKDLLKRLGIS